MPWPARRRAAPASRPDADRTRRRCPLRAVDVGQRRLVLGAAHHDDPPRLHVPARRRPARRLQHPVQHVGGDRVGAAGGAPPAGCSSSRTGRGLPCADPRRSGAARRWRQAQPRLSGHPVERTEVASTNRQRTVDTPVGVEVVPGDGVGLALVHHADLDAAAPGGVVAVDVDHVVLDVRLGRDAVWRCRCTSRVARRRRSRSGHAS